MPVDSQALGEYVLVFHVNWIEERGQNPVAGFRSLRVERGVELQFEFSPLRDRDLIGIGGRIRLLCQQHGHQAAGNQRARDDHASKLSHHSNSPKIHANPFANATFALVCYLTIKHGAGQKENRHAVPICWPAPLAVR